MNSFALAEDILDKSNYDSAVEHLSQTNVLLPTFAELAEPVDRRLQSIPA